MSRGERVEPSNVTDSLNVWQGGDVAFDAAALDFVYDRLKQMANRRLRLEGNVCTIQPTELVHELFIRFGASSKIQFRDRAHFFNMAARTLRRVLVDLARKRGAARRGKGYVMVTLNSLEAVVPATDRLDCLELDDALTALEKVDPRSARVVEMRFFAELTEEEIGEMLNVSAKTIRRDWKWARAWLLAYLNKRAVISRSGIVEP